ncbi:S8 family peptidase [Polycladomyces subterraneus]|uniref:S8 family peptidase n=1 Tax=Polycladomyces subterraneus TaxID=1016997 RepID=A0ABT8IJC9_9BACL|nr:S8 family peptidase [Polycladomyces subterraneus]MDN4592896.1 S8 family peptidase [Polycladomyces subterraneus]
MSKKWMITLIFVTVLWMWIQPMASSPVYSQSGGHPDSQETEELIVGFRDDTSVDTAFDVHRKMGMQVVKSVRGPLRFDVVKVKGKTVEEAVQMYRRMPGVAYAEPNAVFRLQDYFPGYPVYPKDPYYITGQWGVKQVWADIAWDKARSSSRTVVAVLDSGVDDTHSELSGKVIKGYDYVNKDTNPMDDDTQFGGHGTQMAGIIAAQTDNLSGIAGMAPYAKILAIKVCGRDGTCSIANIAQGIQYAVNHGAGVINMSFYGYQSSTTLSNAVNYAYSKGVVMVASAGNDGKNRVTWPCYYSQVVCVGATDMDDKKASFSNYGIWVDVAAPGVDIETTRRGGGYGYASGTSPAAALVSGEAALLKAQGRSYANVISAITKTTDAVPGMGTYWRYGRINAYRAVQY